MLQEGRCWVALDPAAGQATTGIAVHLLDVQCTSRTIGGDLLKISVVSGGHRREGCRLKDPRHSGKMKKSTSIARFITSLSQETSKDVVGSIGEGQNCRNPRPTVWVKLGRLTTNRLCWLRRGIIILLDEDDQGPFDRKTEKRTRAVVKPFFCEWAPRGCCHPVGARNLVACDFFAADSQRHQCQACHMQDHY